VTDDFDDLLAFIGRVGNLYTRKGLCPPFRLKEVYGPTAGYLVDSSHDTSSVASSARRRDFGTASTDALVTSRSHDSRCGAATWRRAVTLDLERPAHTPGPLMVA